MASFVVETDRTELIESGMEAIGSAHYLHHHPNLISKSREFLKEFLEGISEPCLWFLLRSKSSMQRIKRNQLDGLRVSYIEFTRTADSHLLPLWEKSADGYSVAPELVAHAES